MQLKSRIILTFNKFYSNLIKDLKATNNDIKNTIKKNYKVIDKLSEEYIDFFNIQFGDNINVLINETDLEILNNKFIVKDITLLSVLNSIDNDIDKYVFWNYIYILTTLLLVKKEFDSADEDITQYDLLFSKIINILSKIQ